MSEQLRKLLDGMRNHPRPLGPNLPMDCPCTGCGVTIRARPSIPQPKCHSCWDAEDLVRRRARAEDLQMGIPAKLPGWMKASGVGRDFLMADLGAIDSELMPRLMPAVQAILKNPWAPATGFGLVGDTGTGKTHACAAVFRAWLEARANLALTRHMDFVGPWGTFTCWEEELSHLRGLMREHGPAFADRMELLKTCSLLVLDDLGAEKAQDSEKSWSAQQLFEVLNARINEERAVLWTSNLTLGELMDRYGKRLVSRLIALAPAVQMPEALRDRRLTRHSATR